MLHPYFELWMLLLHTVVFKWPLGPSSLCALSNLHWLLWPIFALCIGCSSMRILGLPHYQWVSRLHPLDG